MRFKNAVYWCEWQTVLKPFFKKYDRDNNGTLDMEEISSLFM